MGPVVRERFYEEFLKVGYSKVQDSSGITVAYFALTSLSTSVDNVEQPKARVPNGTIGSCWRRLLAHQSPSRIDLWGQDLLRKNLYSQVFPLTIF